MLKAIHKLTGNLISAFRIENDASWLGKEKDEWVAPRTLVFDYKEKGDVKVFFTKSHVRDGSPVVAHFKHEGDREIYDAQSESKEHKMAKEGVYEAICNGLVKLDNKPLKELISDMEFEYPISNSKKSKIADVIVIFKEWHPIYGKGIIFEVQFSNQIAEVTEDRTFNRVSEGYSVCWLWDGDFDKNLKLRVLNFDGSNHLHIIPFFKAIEEYQKIIEDKSIAKVNEVGLLLDKKISFLNIEKNRQESIYSNHLIEMENAALNHFKEQIADINSSIQKRIESIKDIIKKEKEQDVSTLIQQVNEEIKKEAIEKIVQNHYQDKSLINLFLSQLGDKIIAGEKNLIKGKIEETLNNMIQGNNLQDLINEKLKSISIPEIAHYGKCSGCSKEFNIKTMEFEAGRALCQECFDKLPSNWKKRYVEPKYDKKGVLI